MEEREEREKRQHNIILWNFPESNHTTKTEARADDMKRAQEMIQNIVELDEDELTEPLRLGGKRHEDGRPRCLRFRVTNIETKKEILRYARNLNNKDTPQAERIYINPDMTPAEREHHRRLREEIKERTKNGEKDLIIRDKQIVQRVTKVDFSNILDNNN